MYDKILCPCKCCGIGILVNRDDAFEHLMVDGFIPGYSQWIAHGVLPSRLSSRGENQHNSLGDDDMQGLVHDAFGVPNEDGSTEEYTGSPMDAEIANGQAKEFYKLIDSSQEPLYEGCSKFSKLSFIIHWLHSKCIGSLNNKVFDMLLDLLREVFPDAIVGLPKSYYEAEKLMKKLGLGYEKIHACPNDCTLYWGKMKHELLVAHVICQDDVLQKLLQLALCVLAKHKFFVVFVVLQALPLVEQLFLVTPIVYGSMYC
ncbi:hypothetical protein SASPL_133339 [Salvia splendens]|uniref:Transposase-associated domain-containing protein n=2 Tax=Salvia splendens TaxID=180675 RepID=A0A8X8X2R7_SALSN|nr:hypothetical protein SASPL_133339 [Salvia splendens]